MNEWIQLRILSVTVARPFCSSAVGGVPWAIVGRD